MKASQEDLFRADQMPVLEARGAAEAPSKALPRYQQAQRKQLELRACDLEALLAEDHRARLVWEFVQGLELSPLYGEIRALEGGRGRSPIDPAILMSLWLYATLEGVGSARELARLCDSHDAYRWICGGVSVNHHTLSDFRVGHGAFLDRQLSVSVATLMSEGLVQLNRVSQDGMRVRAAAGAASFRRGRSLKRCLREAEDQVEALKAELGGDASASRRRVEAARARAAKERHERVKKALKALPEVARKKKGEAAKEQARVSTTDSEARVMKMADGGYRPAFNAQLAAETGTQVITGVAVTNEGSDLGQLEPMVEQHHTRYGVRPGQILVDGGFAKHEAIKQLAAAGVCTYAPVQKPKNGERDPHRPRPGDSPAIAQWRERMGTEQAKAIYRERAATIECVNALVRNRGLLRFTVRGLAKAKAVLLWHALAHNLMRTVALRAQSDRMSLVPG